MAFSMGDTGTNMAGRELGVIDGLHCGRSILIDLDSAIFGLSCQKLQEQSTFQLFTTMQYNLRLQSRHFR